MSLTDLVDQYRDLEEALKDRAAETREMRKTLKGLGETIVETMNERGLAQVETPDGNQLELRQVIKK